MPRPRILLVPQLLAIEWTIASTLEDWAEVASFDAPALDAEADFGPAVMAEAGLAEIDRRGWESCYVVADEFSAASAVRLASARPEAVEGLALGHACLSWGTNGERAPITGPVLDAFIQVARGDYRAYAHHLTQTTQGAYDERLVLQFNERVPQQLAIRTAEYAKHHEEPIGELLAELDVPLLFAEHKGCILFTREGFQDAVEAFPHATAISIEGKPSASLEFAEALKRFCTASV